MMLCVYKLWIDCWLSHFIASAKIIDNTGLRSSYNKFSCFELLKLNLSRKMNETPFEEDEYDQFPIQLDLYCIVKFNQKML